MCEFYSQTVPERRRVEITETQTQLATPVVLIIFNRPEQTARVLEAIARVRPKVLLVVGDGPRKHIVGESERVSECRELLEKIDWPCQVLKNFSPTNLGCRNRVSSGLDWVFSKVEEAIILEDDCLPSPDFFRFTSELLERYRTDDRVGTISGTRSALVSMTSSESYHFSNFPNVWGWATWARVWKNYDASIPGWPDQRSSGMLNNVLATQRGINFWVSALDGAHSKKIDTWDYQLTFLHWTQNWLAIVPEKNLVSNIGFGPNATHTLNGNSVFANGSLEKLNFPLIHPLQILRHDQRDRQTENLKFAKPVYELWVHNLFNALPSWLQSPLRLVYGRMRDSNRA